MAQIALMSVFAGTLVVVTITDLQRRVIPDRILLASAGMAVAIAVPSDPGEMPERLAAALGAFALLFVVALTYERGMGMGDVKLAALMGFYLGRAVVPALLIAFVAGSAYGLLLVVRDGAGARRRQIAFGPFLALGGLLAIFVGDEIVDWYLDSFLDG